MKQWLDIDQAPGKLGARQHIIQNQHSGLVWCNFCGHTCPTLGPHLPCRSATLAMLKGAELHCCCPEELSLVGTGENCEKDDLLAKPMGKYQRFMLSE